MNALKRRYGKRAKSFVKPGSYKEGCSGEQKSDVLGSLSNDTLYTTLPYRRDSFMLVGE